MYVYVYNYLDHLGNVRVRYTKDAAVASGVSILEENHYYPLGLKHTNYNTTVLKLRGSSVVVTAGSPVNKYRFNGKEYQDELGLNITVMDFRQYDGAIGRFNTIDALSELDYDKSPYSFARNSPVVLNDPTGLSAESEYGTNDELDQGPHFDHPPGVFGQTVAQSDMTTGDPMGGQLRDVVAETKNIGSSGIERPDKDNDSYDRERDKPFNYWNRVPSGEYGPSSMNPDAMSLSYSGGVNSIFFSANINFGIALTGDDAAFVIGGNLSKGLNGGTPGISDGFQLGFHNNYGGNKDVLSGLGGNDIGYGAALGVGGSFSSTADGKSKASSGVNSLGINLGLSIGAGQFNSTSFSFKLSDVINKARNK